MLTRAMTLYHYCGRASRFSTTAATPLHPVVSCETSGFSLTEARRSPFKRWPDAPSTSPGGIVRTTNISLTLIMLCSTLASMSLQTVPLRRNVVHKLLRAIPRSQCPIHGYPMADHGDGCAGRASPTKAIPNNTSNGFHVLQRLVCIRPTARRRYRAALCGSSS